MSRTSVWISMISWTVLAVVTAWTSVRVASAVYPDLHPGLFLIVWIFAIQAVYGIRGFARRRGWAMASYAPVKH
ncbi:hypothetical protein GAO09_05570 [Rhizobiales bacterium RZME27]|uniref:Uncharacterized protein n=1 Tax=Endobacterium cereale TaxID=2663029 RepID=A0A6A8A9P2_9HYPH|nr:hypothetical protein [Endobacterium cereale]MEB2843605.1 hypothetical protein [Endobacterium cereale]MQY45531.1 hypothetical protein [Endobacterium cereale]